MIYNYLMSERTTYDCLVEYNRICLSAVHGLPRKGNAVTITLGTIERKCKCFV